MCFSVVGTLQTMLYAPSVRMCRISMAESERFPQQATLYFDVLFTQVHSRLSAYLKLTFDLSTKASSEAAQKLMAQVLIYQFPRALFGMEPLVATLEDIAPPPGVAMKSIRRAVGDLLADFDQ